MRAAAKSSWISALTSVRPMASCTNICVLPGSAMRDTVAAISRLCVLVGPLARCGLEANSEATMFCTIDV